VTIATEARWVAINCGASVSFRDHVSDVCARSTVYNLLISFFILHRALLSFYRTIGETHYYGVLAHSLRAHRCIYSA